MTTTEPFAVSGKLLIGSELVPGAVVIVGDRICDVLRGPGPDELPEHVLVAEIVSPGLIDLQVNGGFGVDVGADPAALRLLAERLPETGVTAFLPTVISAPADAYPLTVAAFTAADGAPGARLLGLHVEGPFLAVSRKGAHQQDWIEAAGDDLFAFLLEQPALRLMTLAPERPGSLERIRRLRERGVLVSLGHTDASYERFVAGVDAGAVLAGQVQPCAPFQHRQPGAVGAALTDDRVTVGLIADGVHAHPASLRLAVRAKGAERIALVTDMMAAAGMPAGNYQLGGQDVITDGVAARLPDGTLAGAVLTMDAAIRNLIAWTEATVADALRMASEIPARLLGRSDLGRIAVGATADLTLFDRDLRVVATIVGGQVVYQRKEMGA
ncbi:MAG: N-acetylglucosamine-6-phosphate deacetylase [Chloroflexota bacterium]